MSLTGWPLATVLLLGALLLLVPLALGLPSARGWRPALLRMGQLGLFTVLVLGLVGWTVNRNENLFGTWTDLYRYATGSAPPPATKTIGGKPAVPAAPAKAAPTAEPVPNLPALPSTARFQQLTYTGPKSGLTGSISIHLPVGYDPKAGTGYPVLVAFYGFPGAYTGFTDAANMDYTTQVDAAVAAYKIRAPIIVIPQLHWNGVDSECVDGPQGNVYTWLKDDLPQWITGHLRVASGRSSWATTGYSAGGWCAAFVGLKNPDRYGAAQAFGGYFKPVFSSSYHPLTAEQMASADYDLAALVSTAPPATSIWVQAAKGDTLSGPSQAHFLAQVKAPTSATEVTIDGSGHGFHQWRPYVTNSLEWLAATLPGFAPQS